MAGKPDKRTVMAILFAFVSGHILGSHSVLWQSQTRTCGNVVRSCSTGETQSENRAQPIPLKSGILEIPPPKPAKQYMLSNMSLSPVHDMNRGKSRDDAFRALEKERTWKFLTERYLNRCMHPSTSESGQLDSRQDDPSICDMLVKPTMPWEEPQLAAYSMSEMEYKTTKFTYVIVVNVGYVLSEVKDQSSVIQPDLHFILENHKAYAAARGYGLLAFNSSSWRLPRSRRKMQWIKLAILHHVLRTSKFEYVFMNDADTIFTNFACRLEVIAASTAKSKPDTVVWISSDHNAIMNTGHFLLRNSLFARGYMLACWLAYPLKSKLTDNSAMIAVAGGLDLVRAWTRWPLVDPVLDEATLLMGSGRDQLLHPLLKQADLQAAAKRAVERELDPFIAIMEQRVMNSYAQNWQAGDMLLHTAGVASRKRWAMLKEHAKENSMLQNKSGAESHSHCVVRMDRTRKRVK